MSRGRKAVVQNNSDWESVFYNSVGTYVQYINLRLAKQIKLEPLSNHIKIVGGYAFKSLQYKKQGIPVIRISDFSNEKIILDDVVYYEESKDLERYELNEGDIVIALTGGTIAKLGIVQKGIGKLYLNQRVGKFQVLYPDEFEAEYVYWIARSVQSIIKNLGWGAAIPNVSPRQIEELQFPVPDKETQNGIIDFLNDLRANKLQEDREYFSSEVEEFIFLLQANQISCFELQSELTHQLHLVKLLRQAFLKTAMQGKLVKQNKKDGNAEELLKKINAEKENLKKAKLSSLISEKEIPFQIPESWVWCKLGEIALHSEAGKSYQALEISAQENQIGVIKTSAITSGFFVENKNKLLPNQNMNIDKIKIEKGDIIFCRASGSKGLAGKSCIVMNTPRANLILSDKSIRYVFSENIFKLFIQYFNSSIFAEEYYIKLGTMKSTTMNNITREQFNSLLIPLPPLAEQKRIVNKLEEVMNVCDEISESISQSKTENEKLLKVLLNEAVGVATTYVVAKDKTLTQKIKKFYIDHKNKIFDTIKMDIIEILQTSHEPISAAVLWNSSEYNKDIEAFYAELKRLVDIEKLVVEEKRGKVSFLKLAASEN